jgi:hypothetical protein
LIIEFKEKNEMGDRTDFLDVFQMLDGVHAEIAHTRRQAQCVGALGKQCGLQQRVQEGHPIARPVEHAAFAAVARAVDAATITDRATIRHRIVLDLVSCAAHRKALP